tara:strand:- start:347 stop:535 length:189 start_codon:yes stop_codon:yes gene_type:complete
MHWLVIILGIFLISISLSNPLYRLVIKKRIDLNLFLQIILRILLFILSVIIIFVGLYLESTN